MFETASGWESGAVTVGLDKVQMNEALQDGESHDTDNLLRNLLRVKSGGSMDVRCALSMRMIYSVRGGGDGRYFLIKPLEPCTIPGWQAKDGRRRSDVNIEYVASSLGVHSAPRSLRKPGPPH